MLDFSIMLAGPYCARLFADMGAEVLKIEPPEGDDMRLRAPLRDGQSVVSWLGSAGLYCHDLDGKELWHRDLGRQRLRDDHRFL